MTLRALLGPVSAGTALDDAGLEALYGHQRSVVRAGLVTALDGAVEVDGRSGGLGAEDDTTLLATLRACADVVLVAAGTLRTEGYGPAWLGEERRARRAARAQDPLPTIAIVTASADLDPSLRVFTERREDQPVPPRPVVVTTSRAGTDHLAAAADVVVAGDERVDLAAALGQLAGRGLDRVVCEGGPTLVSSLAAAGLLDELCLSHAPVLAGPGHTTLAGNGPPLATPQRFALAHLLSGDGGLLAARYVRVERAGDG